MQQIQKLSEFLGISENVFQEEGILNRFVGVDLPMFLDPRLLDKLESIEEFKGSREKFLKHFRGVLSLIEINEISSANSKMVFKEVKGIGLGYSKNSDNGSGINIKLAKQLVQRMKKIDEEGSKNPEMFELMPLFLDNFSYDRISDAVARILQKNIYNFTTRIIQNNPTTVNTYRENGLVIPLDNYGHPILLIPKTIANSIEIEEESWFMNTLSGSFKDGVDKMILLDWKKLKKEEKVKQYEDSVDIPKFIAKYLTQDRSVYDFEKDVKGRVVWYDAAKEISKDIIKVNGFNEIRITDINVLFSFVEQILLRLKHHFENTQTALKAFYYADENNRDRKFNESQVQAVLLLIATEICRLSNVDVSPEVNKDRGPLDFKFSHGNLKIAVEVKLTSGDLIHGYNTQLPEYMKAEETRKGIFLVIINTKNPKEKLQQLYNLKDTEEYVDDFPQIMIIDGRKKESASKYKKQAIKKS